MINTKCMENPQSFIPTYPFSYVPCFSKTSQAPANKLVNSVVYESCPSSLYSGIVIGVMILRIFTHAPVPHSKLQV